MVCHTIDTIAAVFTAIGTVSVAVLAIWGDQIRDRLFGPRLELSLVDPKGDLTFIENANAKRYYYHLRVSNQKGRNAAIGTRVVIQGHSRRTPSGQFVRQPLVYPLQLQWTPAGWNEIERTVVHDSTCDFGHVGQFELKFHPTLLSWPNNFAGFVGKDECVRFEIAAVGHNVLSPVPSVFEVSWDGRWTENQEEMQRRLVIRKVPEL
jgi:hypothetical protein